MKVALLKRELDIMSCLDHPNIVKLYESYEDEKYVHLIMDYCSGGDVSERIIDNGVYSEAEASNLMEKLLCAVEYLHSNKISHRDLKSDNFLYEDSSKNSEIKIADFGMSMKYGNNLRMKSLAGTPYYLAPEILKGSYTKSCDIWSLGVFLYYIISGSYPFYGFQLEDIFEKVAAGKIKFEGSVWQKASDSVKDLIKKMLTIDPVKRISIYKALSHPWFKKNKKNISEVVPFHIFNTLKQNKAHEKLWQEALKVIVRSLSQTQISDLKKWFKQIDKNNSGTITALELSEAMKLSGYQYAEEELDKIIANNSYMQEGIIQYSEFLIATLDKKTLLDEQVLWEAFKYFDVDNDGIISLPDLQKAFKKSGTEFSENELVQLMSGNQFGSLENVRFDEFKSIFASKNSETVETLETDAISKIVRKVTKDFNLRIFE